MKNSDLNNEYLDDKIDLIELLRTIYSSKKLIIILTLAFSLLAFIYTTQKELEYQSNVVLEVGSYRLLDGEKTLVEPVPNLIKNLKVNLIYKKQLPGLDDKKLNFKSIEDQLLEINYTSPSPEFNENLINEAIRFTQKSHAETLDKIVNSFSEKIVTIDNEVEFLKLNAINAIKAIDSEVEFLKNSIKNQQESQKLNAINAIKAIDSQIPALESKIKFLLELIPAEENNLLLLKSSPSALLQRASSSPTLQQIIYSYNDQTITLKNQIQNLQLEKNTLELQVKSIAEGEFASEELFKLQQEKDTLELQVKSIAEGEFASEELFKLQQEKDTLKLQVKSIAEGKFVSKELFKLLQEKDALELQIKFVNDQANSTKPIRELVTSKIKPRQLLTILIGTILGFIFSVLIVLIRQAFLKEQN
jgi:LPS O-antigen subunit length determinant protein (WzzB/FepE family)